MRIGNLPEIGDALLEGKWYFGLEIRSCPPQMIRAFRPYVRIVLVKWRRLPDYGKIYSEPEDRTGGWWEFLSPLEISCRIEWYGWRSIKL